MSEETPKTTSQESMSRNKGNAGIALILLALIVLLGGYFRFTGINWDDYSALHPDERYLTLNLLPQIGGHLQFTPDAEHFPSQTVLIQSDNLLIVSEYDIQINDFIVVGSVRNSMSDNLAKWWLGSDRVVDFANADAAYQALLGENVEAIILSELDAPRYTTTSTIALATFTSERVQETRCSALNPDTNGIGGYFDTYCSPLNPHNAYSGSYAYGTLPLFMAHFGGDILENIQNFGLATDDSDYRALSYQEGVLVWRFLSAFFDIGAIILIFFIGSRMHNRWVGLMAALLYACAPLAIQKAHFGTVNAITAFFVTLAIWSAINVQDKGKFAHYIIFGIAFGAALAGRINVIPLAGLVVLAGMVNAAPVLDRRIVWSERERLLVRNIAGVFIAGAATVLTFRLLNPYAFTGPSFFHMIPNMRWIADAQGSSFAVSGASDAPPNWQWLARASYLYPLSDMLLWGMGIAMGVMAWVGFSWSGYRLLSGKYFSLRNILPFAWVLVYFAWIGDLWVMTMRYYLPLYSSLALLAAWALYELYRQSKERDLALTRVLLIGFGIFFSIIPIVQINVSGMTPTAMASAVIAIILIALAVIPKIPFRATALAGFVLVFTTIWGLMFSNIYQHQLTRVQAARWASEFIPADFSMEIDGAPDGTPLINIGVFNRSGDSAANPDNLIGSASRFDEVLPYLFEFTAPASGTVTHVYAPHLADPMDDPEEETLYVSVSRNNEGETLQLLAESTLTANFSRENHPLGDAYELVFDTPIELLEGESYTFKVEAIAGPISSAGAVMLTEGTWDDRITTVPLCPLPDGMTYYDDPRSGLVPVEECSGMTLASSMFQSYDLQMSYPVDEQLKLDSLLAGLEAGDYIAITSNRFYDTESRNPARFPMTTAYYQALFNGELGYELVMTFSESYEIGVFSVDDQHLPIYDSSNWLNELEADEAFHVYDHPAVFIFQKTEDYDPATTEMLLSVPLQRIDTIGFGSQQFGAQIPGVVYWTSLESDEAPTALMQPQEVHELNSSGGTWSERFDSDSLLNTNQLVGVIVWWMTIVLIGLLTFPLLLTAFPKLGDMGYGFSKIIGMLLIGWIAWIGANFRVPLWSQGGLAGIMLLLIGLSVYLTYVRREMLLDYLSKHWGRLLTIEVLSFILYIAFILVRLSNPDLWHHPMGGEKPMDFAYFNAVLRTTVFPVSDPWYAGGYINYYYFGYVIVGVPTLLLKIVPAFAYNLIVPTLFSVTGIGAFSAAFNIVDAWTSRQVETFDNEKVTVVRQMGNPYVAGIVAMLMCVVLGNLDTPRVLIEEGIARLGGYERPTGLENYLIDAYVDDNGIVPEGEDLLAIQTRAERNSLPDQISFTIATKVDLATSFFRGFGRAMAGEPLPIGSNRWYWAPTRVIDETPGVGGNAITEMPFFTFVYGDLHAHMINMPIMLFAIAFVFYEVTSGRRDERTVFAQFLAIFFGALAIGMMRATNTWDWPSFMLLAIVGLGYAWWRRWEHTFNTDVTLKAIVFTLPIAVLTGGLAFWLVSSTGAQVVGNPGLMVTLANNIVIKALLVVLIAAGTMISLWFLAPLISDGVNRRSLTHMLIYIGGFITISTFVVAPFNHWYGSVYNSVLPWEGNQTPLWAYWNIHGLFLFLITSLLIWETSRWLGNAYVRDLRGQGIGLMIGAGVVVVILLGALILAMTGNQVALVAIPLIVWIAILFFRPGQSAPMQYVLVLAGFALSLTLGVEMVVLSGDIGRQNTVFKFYIQAWLLFSVAGGAAFAWLIQRADLWRFRVQLLWFFPLMFIVAAATMFPFASVRARMVDRFVPDLAPTLNGLDYMEETTYFLPYAGSVISLENDYNIIRWLQENVEGTPIVIEGRGAASEYHYNGRIAINTGLPTVLGWNWHQRQQRTIDPLPRIVQQRESNIQHFYQSNDIVSVVNMIRYYDIEYIIVSDMEIALYPDGIEKFNRMVEMGLLDIAYQHGVGLVYQTNDEVVDTFMRNQIAFNDTIGLDETLLPSFVPSGSVIGHVPDETVNVDAIIEVLAEDDMSYLVITNPPRVIEYMPDVYDRLLRLEVLGVLTRLDDSEARRTYVVNQDTVQELMGEDN